MPVLQNVFSVFYLRFCFTFFRRVLPHKVTRLSQHRLPHCNPQNIFNLLINLLVTSLSAFRLCPSSLRAGLRAICKLSPDLLFCISTILLGNLRAVKLFYSLRKYLHCDSLWISFHAPWINCTDRYVHVFVLSGSVTKINQMFYFNRTCQYHTLNCVWPGFLPLIMWHVADILRASVWRLPCHVQLGFLGLCLCPISLHNNFLTHIPD